MFRARAGDDDFGRRLREEAERVGVRCCFQVIENCAEKGIPTGTCACLITGSNRCALRFYVYTTLYKSTV